ncbi:arylsulfatase [Fischerella sp. PCC 9605]|uniref:arylsulfatase n=1 Tax=Fischerella sp. PCC 9605 TaxID=1173024 RepID=UPI0004BC3BE1|nr:arylsulfatase [Fischerella sp. PCC 9605]
MEAKTEQINNAENGQDMTQRHVLPIPDVTPINLTTFDARDPDTQYPPIRQIRPPAGAPNVLVILIDDAGFGSSSAFGGPCQTPNFEKLAAGGLRYTRFHTTALCSPTRAALLSGRNHHSVGMGGITEFATSAPGTNSMKPNTCAALAETLKLNGYATAQFGKCHEVPVWETSAIGPFDHWPTGGGGFQYFYGFLGGETNQYYPGLYEGTTSIEPPRTPEQGYTLNEDLADRAIAWIHQQKALTPDNPFFIYYAPGATHAPHHVPKEWSDKYKGKFDQGWDKLREETYARQLQLGVIPKDSQLTSRHPEIPAWDSVDPEMKPVLARQMEVYAGFMEQTDHHVGRVLDALTDLGILEDTLVYLIIGDNGASAEGSLQGTFNEMVTLGGFGHLETAESLIPKIDDFGSPKAYNHYAVGWAHAMDTPYQWTKQVASHFGGTRNGTIVHWPKGIKAKGEIRSQFHHVIDVAPTILEVAGLPQPLMVNGVLQRPLEGVSMAYSFNDAGAADRHETQYFEMFGNRGIYHKGWTAVTKHRTPWETGQVKTVAFNDDVWELYDTSKDWSQAKDLSKQHPDILHKLQQLWLIEAVKYNVLPLDDRFAERANSEIAGRPDLIRGNRQIIFGPMARVPSLAMLPFQNKSYALTAQLQVPTSGAEGVIVALGGVTGGLSIYVKNGKPKVCYNFFGLEQTYVEGTAVIPPGDHQVRLEFAYDGGGIAKGGTLSLFIDGKKSGEGRVEQTQPFAFGEEPCNVGHDSGSFVTTDYAGNGSRAFSGQVKWVEFDTGVAADDHNHLITAEERLRVAMAKQ